MIKKIEGIVENSHGEKLRKLFNEYDVDILSIEKANFLNSFKCRLPFEDRVEYRVTLGEIFTFEKFLYNNDMEDLLPEFRKRKNVLRSEALEMCERYTVEKFGKESWEKYTLPDVKSLNTVRSVSNQSLIFSIFSKSDIQLDDLAKAYAWQCAYLYFFILKKTAKVIYSGAITESHEVLHEINATQFLDMTKCNMSNKTIKTINDVTYRLYKDAKFFYELCGYFEEAKMNYSHFIKRVERIK